MVEWSLWQQVFTMWLVLVAPDLDKEIRVEANTLEYTMRRVLSIKCENEK